MTTAKSQNIFKRLFAKKAEESSTASYHAVEICCGKTACRAAQDCRKERYLSTKPPLLPLDQCDRPDLCECRYQHHDDRRGGPRRRAEQGMPETKDLERLERRYKNDRRVQEDSDEAEPFSVHEDSYHEHVGDTIRTAALKADEAEGFDPYDSGSFDKSRSWDKNPK